MSYNWLSMIGGNQPAHFFSIKYTEKNPFPKQLHRYSEQTPLADAQSISSYRAAYNPQPSSRYRRDSLSPQIKKAEKSVNLRQSNRQIDRTPQYKKTERTPQYTINKDAPRIDIELYDETANGGKWQKMRGRVVYRNNAPKNSYYLLSCMKELVQQNEQQLPRISRNLSRDELEFNSKFESGNAAAVVRVSREEYCVFTREDTNTHGLRQWFYFQVKCNRSMRVRLRVYSFSKHYSLYRRGMKPYIKTGIQWVQSGEEVTYSRDQQLNCYCLAFSINLQEGSRVQIANMPPYTYSLLLRFLNRLQNTFPIRLETIGSSLGGVDIPSLHITSPKSGEQRRRAIVILGRTHPGETCSSYSLQRIAQGLCQSQFLRSKYDFFIVPMVNPDGVIVGNHRTSIIGTDLNRRFTNSFTHRQLFPQVQAVKRLVRQLQQTHSVQFVFDLHGHSAQAGVFAYAGYEEAGSPHFLKSRIIPRLLSQAWHGFDQDSCAFQQVREKATTARVHFRTRCSITSVTIEQSYGILGNRLITVDDWRGFGDAFLVAIMEYTRRYLENPESLRKALQKEIQQQLQEEGVQQQKKPDEALGVESAIQNNKEQPSLPKSQQKKAHPIPKQACEVEQESMQSGDDDLQITEEELNFIQQNMNIRVRQPTQRQAYQLNDNTIQYQPIRNHSQVRHSGIHDKLSLVSRILRTKQRKKSVELIDILTGRANQHTQHRKKTINTSVRLPSLPQKF